MKMKERVRLIGNQRRILRKSVYYLITVVRCYGTKSRKHLFLVDLDELEYSMLLRLGVFYRNSDFQDTTFIECF